MNSIAMILKQKGNSVTMRSGNLARNLYLYYVQFIYRSDDCVGDGDFRILVQ